MRELFAASQEELTETQLVLESMTRQRFGAIPSELLTEHVLRCTTDADFPVRKGAMEALLRRQGFARRDELRVASRPAGGRALGEYVTRGRTSPGPDAGSKAARGNKTARGKGRGKKAPRRKPRPYVTRVESVEPLRGSCTCPDFVRGSLGICKHLLVAFDEIFSTKTRLAKARAEQRRVQASIASKPNLRWQPVRPLLGDGDRLKGLQWIEPVANNAPANAKRQHARRWFKRGQLDGRALGSLKQRHQLIADLLAASSPDSRGRPAIEAEPAAVALLQEEQERAERLLACRRDAAEIRRHLRGLKRKLYPYQREGVDRFLAAGRLLLADDMGLGKTVQAVAVCQALYLSGRVRRGLLIVPASLKTQWLREWEATTGVPAAIVDGRPAERAEQYRKLRRGFLIINYELLLRDLPLVHELAPEIVVLDEAQRIKNFATKSAVYVKSLSPRYRLVLTGTPMENRLDELASIMDWIDDVAMAPKWRLVPWHTTWEGDGGRGRAGARNLDTLRTRLQPCLVRRVRQEVLAQLPSRTDTRVPVEMTSQQVAEHDSLAQPIAQLMRRAETRPLTQPEFLRLMSLLTTQRIISNGLGQLRFDEIWPAYSSSRPEPALLDGLFSPKLVELRRLLSELVVEQQRKVVVFSQWRKMLRLAEWSTRGICERAGIRATFFTGAENTRKRTQSVADFHDDPDVRVMYLTDAGGVGLNLQRAATCCINLELPWNPAVLEQRIGRIYRLGQKHPIDVYNLISESGIESRIASLVGTKQALFSGLFDGSSDEVKFDQAGSFMGQVRVLTEAPELPEMPARAAVPTSPQPSDDDMDLEDDEFPPGEPNEPSAAVAPAPTSAEGTPAPTSEALGQPSLAPMPADVATLFESVRVHRRRDGGIRLEAPPEAAAPLVAMFDAMAKLLDQAARPG